MKRRDFIKGGLGAGVALTALPALGATSARALAWSPSLQAMQKMAAGTDKIFVLIQLDGGNDGLNTVVPYSNQLYHDARSTLAFGESDVLKINDGLGWHPRLTDFNRLFNEEKLALVQGVTYPNPNRSHFRGTDIWNTASDSDVFLSTGWIGRYLEAVNPEFPTVLPPDPLAIQVGTNSSLSFLSSKGNTGIIFRNYQEFIDIASGEGVTYPSSPDTPAGHELDYIRSVAEASRLYADRVQVAADNGQNSPSIVYPETGLANSLKTVAHMISGGLQTQFYLVSLRGFDTHALQLNAHDNLMNELNGAVNAFMEDINAQGFGDKVAGMTFSEFGRRVNENGSQGTDHGAAAPLFVFGNKVIGNTIHGEDPDLVNLDSRGDLTMQFDYRQVYASALAQWFLSPKNEIEQILMGEFETIKLFDTASSVDGFGLASDVESRVYPNPFRSQTVIEYSLPESADVIIEIVDVKGNVVAAQRMGRQDLGVHRMELRLPESVAGTYFYRIHADRRRVVGSLQKVQ